MSDLQDADDFGKGDPQAFTSTDARMVVLELSVAALIAQLPPQSLEEVAGLLCFVANSTEDAEDLAPDDGASALRHVRHWANQMLQRVMSSRKASRGDKPDPTPPVPAASAGNCGAS